jgi:hypothetical protein
MKADVIKEAKNVETDKPTKGCGGQKVSESWCTKQTDQCKTQGTCGKKCYCPVVT